MFKICNDKTYYVVQTTSEDVVVEIYTKKDGRGSGISLHEMHLDLCRAIRKLQHDGYTIMKVYPAMGDRRESIDVLSMPEFIQSAKCPDNDEAGKVPELWSLPLFLRTHTCVRQRRK